MKTMAIEIKTSTEKEKQPNGKLENGKIDTNKLSKMQHWETCLEIVNLTLRDMADRARSLTNIYIRENAVKAIFHKKIMGRNFPHLFKDVKLQMQELQQISSRITFTKHKGMADKQKKKKI